MVENASNNGEFKMSGNDNEELVKALQSTLGHLGESVARMEAIVKELESSELDWDDSMKLLEEANELAFDSSRQLEKAVQEAAYWNTYEEKTEKATGAVEEVENDGSF